MKPIFDDSALIDWLGSQNPTGTYEYIDGHCCMLARYLKYRGFQDAVVNADIVIAPVMRVLPKGWDGVACQRPWTFGAALERARASLGRQSHITGKITGKGVNFIIIDEVAA